MLDDVGVEVDEVAFERNPLLVQRLRGGARENRLVRAEELAHVVRAGVDLTAHRVDVDALAVVEVAREAVVLVARDTARARADRDDRLRVAADEPVRHVDVVDVLLADVVAGKLGEVEPVLAEVGGVALVLVAPRDPRHVAVPVDRAAEDRPEPALVERLLDEQIAALVAALRAAHDGELLLRRELRGRDHLAHAGRVDRDALLGEDVLAVLDGEHRVAGAEVERRREDHDVHVGAVDRLLVAVRAAEGVRGGRAELLGRRLRLFKEVVRKRDGLHLDLDALLGKLGGRLDQVTERAHAVVVLLALRLVAAAHAAPAAADDRRADHAHVALLGHRRHRRHGGRKTARLDEVFTCHLFVFSFIPIGLKLSG